MKKHLLFVALALAVVVPFFAFAETTTNSDSGWTDYKTIGEQYMQNVMGPSYDSYQSQMQGMMGQDFTDKMKEAMGKSWASGKGYLMMPMMSGGYGSYGNNSGMMNWGGKMSWGIKAIGFIFCLMIFIIVFEVMVLLMILIKKMKWHMIEEWKMKREK